ncbi:shikimate kinase [Legionella busanensis]|uniref:Shikimate kinase n=1 Tax=Legionella busanensis TaxID=190655 RepID=A0A378JPI4_9GAMM|nr:LuxR family transcriptional regulator [Legionella busanensis]STX52631.1 shikimate kinase [Legionella busanensis]
MKKYTRIFIIGHPGAGKTLLAQSLATQLGWEFADADFGLEYKIGRRVHEIMGPKGAASFFKCQKDVLTSLLKRENIVVATDANIIESKEISKLLEKEYLVYLQVSLPMQLDRLSRNPVPLLLKPMEIDAFLQALQSQRNSLYENLAMITINSDDNNLEHHVRTIQENITDAKSSKSNIQLNLEKKDLTIFHKTLHTPISLTKQQAKCVKLLAQGKAAKEIAKELKTSYRTVEGNLAKVMEKLGCHTSKELLALYHS